MLLSHRGVPHLCSAQSALVCSVSYTCDTVLQVLDAMVRVVTNQLGALPPTYFNVTISASVEDLAQLMYSLLMLGYMYRNAQYKIDLDHLGRRSLGLYPPKRIAILKHFSGVRINSMCLASRMVCMVY